MRLLADMLIYYHWFFRAIQRVEMRAKDNLWLTRHENFIQFSLKCLVFKTGVNISGYPLVTGHIRSQQYLCTEPSVVKRQQ